MVKLATFLPFLLPAVFSPLTKGASWGYSGDTGPANWASVVANSSCAASSQSPINIVSASATKEDFSAFSFTGYDEVPVDATMTLSNNGHSVLVALSSASNGIAVSGGGLTGSYYAAQFHFHWGSPSDLTLGSEHTLNGNSYPGELHIVHHSSSYSTTGDALASGSSTALAVLGFFLEISDSDNPGLAPIIENIQNVNESGTSYPLSTNIALDTILPSSRTNFYRYSGSLTTPTCDEVVVWTVFEDTVKISESQLSTLLNSAYFTAEDGQAPELMLSNYRPVQSLNGRTVYSSFSVGASWRILPAWHILLAALLCAIAANGRQ